MEYIDIITVCRYNVYKVGDDLMINAAIERKGITKYRLAKSCGIPYSTISDICNGKTQLEKCSAETVYRIAKELEVSMELLLESHLDKYQHFELFKNKD